MYELIYHSLAIPNISSKDINDILEVAREFNAKNNITGCLLYHNYEFVQILEGEKEIIKQLFSSIEKDDRHSKVDVLYEAEIKDRNFPDWSMAFEDLSVKSMNSIKDHLDIQTFENLIDFIGQPTKAKELFVLLSKSMLETDVGLKLFD